MNSIEGKLYDGNSSKSHDVRFGISDSGEFQLEGYEMAEVEFSQISVSSRIGDSARYLDLANGVRIETSDNDAVDRLLKILGPEKEGFLHTIENNLLAVILSLVTLVSFVFVVAVYGIPAMSGPLVRMLPPGVDDLLGKEVLDQLDSIVFEPSSLSSTEKGNLLELFATLIPETDREFDLQFRSSELLGANAFALPNAQIVFTDELVQLGASEEMLAAIMLHEIGHVVERHTMQAVVRRAGFSMLLFGVTGDVGSAATALVVLLPSFLIESSYSRDLEWDADSYALSQMSERGIDANAFADMMELMLGSTPEDAESTDSTQDSANSFSTYFGTHPPTQSRIERFRQASGI